VKASKKTEPVVDTVTAAISELLPRRLVSLFPPLSSFPPHHLPFPHNLPTPPDNFTLFSFHSYRIQFIRATKASTRFNVESISRSSLDGVPQLPSSDNTMIMMPDNPIFPYEGLAHVLKWNVVSKIGPGLKNLGNSCFVSAILQCLSYNPPLAQLSLKGTHTSICKGQKDSCFYCLFERHVKDVFSKKDGTGDDPIAPTAFVSRLRLISKSFKLGKQEDVHEFLREFIEKLQVASLKVGNHIEKHVGMLAQTTLPYQIFGGFLRNKLTCSQCNFSKSIYEPFLDLALVSVNLSIYHALC
jgi:ubiquitin C-terminal hydrolase